MKEVPGGAFAMGSEDFYPEEAPVRRVEVEAFWIDERPVTVGQFRRFVKETGYVTVAERPLDPALYPDADTSLLVAGSLVFPPGACARRPVGLPELVVVHAGGDLGAAGGTGERHLRPRTPPGHASRLRGRRGVRGVGGQDAADRGRVGVQCARRARGQGLRMG